MFALFGMALLKKLAPTLIIAAVIIGGLLMFAYYQRGIGYAQCKAEWDQAIANTNNTVRDATGRARDPSVPDPFDSNKP